MEFQEDALWWHETCLYKSECTSYAPLKIIVNRGGFL